VHLGHVRRECVKHAARLIWVKQGEDAQMHFGTSGTKTREGRGSGESAEKVTMSPEKFGTFGTQVREIRGSGVLAEMEQKARLNLGHERVKYTVRVFWPKMEQLALFDLGHLGQKVPKYATWAVWAKMEQLARKVLDTWNMKERSMRFG
ncbi:hypothetical protein KI387_003851, partial [Taxus chinensis]